MKKMRRKVIYMCRFLLRRLKQLIPLLILALTFIFIAQDQTTTSIHVFGERSQFQTNWKNSSISLHNSTGIIPKEMTKATEADFMRFMINGERNAERSKNVCQKYPSTQKEIQITGRINKNNTLLFCPIYKVGTTFWRRVFMIDGEKRKTGRVNPYEIPFDKDYPGRKFIFNRNNITKYYKVMFTRDPYNRLFSFFVDKMMAPNPYFWKTVGVKVALWTRNVPKEKIKSLCGHDITFPEFIRYVIHTLEIRKDIDPHWVEMERNCYPCDLNYDFIGKMEEFQEDSTHILNKLGLTKMASFLEKNGKGAAVDDAIKDTLNQPFSFRAKYKRCMSFKDAILRAWKKLQIRGLIGNDTFDINIVNEKSTKLSDIIPRANVSRQSCTSQQRKKLKEEAFKQFWGDVPLNDLNKLQKLYTKDFELFDYDKSPPPLFHSRVVSSQ